MLISFTLDLEHEGGSAGEAIKRNMAAMDWALDHSPMAHITGLADNKYILQQIFRAYDMEHKYSELYD